MAIVTRQGQADIATATFEQLDIRWTKFVIGDGNGISYAPRDDQTELVNQVYEGDIESYHATDPITGVFDLVLPANVGGFMIREVGLLNQDGDLVAVDCLPQDEAQPKVKFDSENSSRFNDMIIHFAVHIDDAENVKIMVDPNSAIASRDYVDEQIKNLKLDMNEVENDDVDRIFEMTASEPGGYPDDWEEATEDDIDAFF